MEPHEAIEQHEQAEEATKGEGEGPGHARLAAITIAALAALLAIVTGLGNNAVTKTILSQAKAADTYNEYQANSFKKHMNDNTAAILKVVSASSPSKATALSLAAALKHENTSKYIPRQAELLPRAVQYEKDRDRGEDQHHVLQFAEGSVQLAIVLCSASVIVGVRSLLLAGVGLGLLGLLLGIDGLTLLYHLPF